ncbi:MAG: ParB N-terminal domain-containing protein [Gordonia sp.]|nr:ParB N-terminal domain-containing protein [Gordonia sp. (in: high G+C Gram-positive bacteria)]
MVPVVDLDPHPHNPRRHLGELTELAASIARQGVLDELVVVAGEKAGRWWIEGP